MPELAEVEYYRKCWDAGLRQRVKQVALHGEKRIFRGADLPLLEQALTGAQLLESETRGKQIAFRFTKGAWLGLHLGMTGDLRIEPTSFEPQKHDHLVLYQAKQALVFSDPRLFGRVRFHQGAEPPEWWASGPPGISSAEWSLDYLRAALRGARLRSRRCSSRKSSSRAWATGWRMKSSGGRTCIPDCCRRRCACRRCGLSGKRRGRSRASRSRQSAWTGEIPRRIGSSMCGGRRPGSAPGTAWCCGANHRRAHHRLCPRCQRAPKSH